MDHERSNRSQLKRHTKHRGSIKNRMKSSSWFFVCFTALSVIQNIQNSLAATAFKSNICSFYRSSEVDETVQFCYNVHTFNSSTPSVCQKTCELDEQCAVADFGKSICRIFYGPECSLVRCKNATTTRQTYRCKHIFNLTNTT